MIHIRLVAPEFDLTHINIITTSVVPSGNRRCLVETPN